MSDEETQELQHLMRESNTRLSRIEGGLVNQVRICGLCQESVHTLNLELHDPRNGIQPRLLKVEGHAAIVREVERRAWITVKDAIVAVVAALAGTT